MAEPAVQALLHATWQPLVDPSPIPTDVTTLGSGDDGETAVIAYAIANTGSAVVVDDRAARNAAAKLGSIINLP